ncbi:hypothetical protein J2128_000316 [Methanomicrobium sp. W14]|uniref:hypothetical protein n=1 Tax=Methanomicrobium sp. W14 TaxID=2817839 RepID=UPI001AE7285F|nr:hypothetical protein [Methanomicrobium sp. W14]MBP2132395.1 hypothetical protein [Methanomicrobium sp. W14]
MKTKKGMWALSLLFVLALIGTMFVPVVSAENNTLQPDQENQYNEEKYTVRLVGSGISQDQIDAQDQEVLNSFEKEFKSLPSQYIGFAEPDISKDEKIVGYAFRVLPSGESLSYAEVVPSNETYSSKKASTNIDNWINGPLNVKTLESFKELKTSSSSGPHQIHTSRISRNYPGVGNAQLISSWYWDNLETNSDQDYFFTKTILRTDPGIIVSGYEPYKNFQFNVEINSDYSLGSYQHLPSVFVSQNNPQTTTGYTNMGLSLNSGGCSLEWTTEIPDRCVEFNHLSGNKFSWDEEFRSGTDCAEHSFEFSPGQESVCSQAPARDGNTYIISRVKADVSNGWTIFKNGVPGYAPSGTNAWGHYCKVRWTGNGYVHV